MWDLPGPGLKPVSLALAGRFLTTVPPGKPCVDILFYFILLFYFICLKSLLNLLQYYFCFMFWFCGREACGILAPRPGVEPTPPALEGEVLTTEPPGKSLC